MAIPVAAAVAGASATAAYLDAKLHIRHDLSLARLPINPARALEFTAERTRNHKLLMYHMIEDHASGKQSNALFLEFEDRSWTYKQFYDDLQRVGNWLMNDLGVKKGEMVAIDGPNSAEYLMLWFALDGIGACISNINCNLTGAPLVHSVKLCESRYLIAERGTAHLVEPCKDEMAKSTIQTIYYDQTFIGALSNKTPIPRSRNSDIDPSSIKSLLYTSGTTGLPKGVVMLTGRVINTARAAALFLKLKPGDKFYTCLPLYHASAQGLCTLPVIYMGAAMKLGRKFSHNTFWPEVSASRANILQYVGELCRYLVNAPPHPLERKHNVQVAFGNGMRPDVWENFRQRFNIPIITEFYSATDGMGITFNTNRGPFTRNAIALRGWLWNLARRSVEVRAKIDPDTEDIVRGNDGFVVKAGVNQPGETLYKVDPAMASASFTGYYKQDGATNKRWIRDVFQKGDLWFRSGDLMRQDAEGRVYFVDRLGDTFRWKSENVSTNEVSDILGTFEQIAECSVYGVAIPHADGRCGCATIVPTTSTPLEAIDFSRLAQHVTSQLPRYAVPLFLRIAPELAYTGNFKIQKGPAKREGVDLDLIEASGSKDRVFWLPLGSSTYVPFRREDWEALKAGRVKL